MTGLMTNERVKGYLAQFNYLQEHTGKLTVNHDADAGTITVKEGDTEVFKAIQKNPNGPWIATTKDGEMVKWKL